MSRRAKILLAVMLSAGVAIGAYSTFASRRDQREISKVVKEYVMALYARDFARAYDFVSKLDGAQKSRDVYIDERQPFTGFTLRLTRKLAESVEAVAADPLIGGERAKAKFNVAVPDVERLAPELLDWDEERLNSLSFTDQQELIAKVDRWQKELRVPLTRVEETFELVREPQGWKIFLNWRSPVVVEVGVQMPDKAPLEAEPAPAQLAFTPGEPFTINVHVKNTSRREVRARVAHRIEPATLEKYLGVGECGTFVPFRLAAGKQDQNRSTFLVWTDLPAQTKKFRMIYEFEIDKPE